MISYPAINPVALSLGPLQIHWYGIMYLLAFAGAYFLATRNSLRPWSPIKKTQVEDLIVYGAWGVILGGRLGYMFFYNGDKWLADPAMLFRIWEGGMSFHGGLVTMLYLRTALRAAASCAGLKRWPKPQAPARPVPQSWSTKQPGPYELAQSLAVTSAM